MKTLVFGANGFVGRHLTRHLIRAGRFVVPLSSSDGTINPESGLLAPDWQFPLGTDEVIYLSQSPFYKQLPEKISHLWAVNCETLDRVAELAAQNNVKRFIHFSSGSVYRPKFTPFNEGAVDLDRENPYTRSKIEGEERLEKYNARMKISSIRLFCAFGEGQKNMLIANLIESVRMGRPINIQSAYVGESNPGGKIFSLCYVGDLVQLVHRLLEVDHHGAINVSGPEALSIRQIGERIGEVVGKAPQFHFDSNVRDGDLIADSSLLNSLISFKFTSFSDAIEKTLRASR